MSSGRRRSRARMRPQPTPVVASLPEDKRNTARETRARFTYQDECAALALLNHLGSDDLDGVLIEHSTDLILLPADGVPELVSIKHREPNQKGEPGWSWNALKRQSVLIDLYDAWISADRHCTLAFWTNAGFNGASHRLWLVCARHEVPTEDLLRSLSTQLGASRPDIEGFLAALKIPENPLPRRKEITDIGVRRTAELLQKYRPGSPLNAEKCYKALVDRIAKAGTDVSEGEALPKPDVAATLAAVADARQIRVMRRFISANQIRNELLSLHDRLAATSLPDVGQHGWEPDAQFIGRSEFLSELGDLLRPGTPMEVSPVVIHGIPGCGKTSLAAQFAATHKAVFRPIFITASSRAALISELTALAGQVNTSNWSEGIAQLRGPVTPRLPGNSATLLIIDGVTDADIVLGIVPRKSLCRVIITSNVSYLEQGYQHIELDCWSREESDKFIAAVLNEASSEDRERLARALYDHPLALTQSVNYCRLTGQDITEYLVRLAREPLAVLDRGQASGHIDSVLKAIRINIDAANERFPRCEEMLYLFAHLASSPIDESVLSEEFPIAFAIEPQVQTVDTNKRRRFARKRRTAEKLRLTYSNTQRGYDLFKSLCNDSWREQAIDTLFLTSLISRRDNGLVVHPLVSFLARQLAGDPDPWVEVGLGLFYAHIEQGFSHDFTTIDPYIDHLTALASTALDAGLTGPAVLGTCQALSLRLGILGVEQHGGRTGIEFGQRAVEIAERSINSPMGSVRRLAESRNGLAVALWEAGFADKAIAQLRQNLQLNLEYDLGNIYDISMFDLGLMVADTSNLELVEETLDQLNTTIERIPSDSPVRLISARHVKTRLLRRLGRIDGARRLNDEALALAQETPTCPERVVEELHGDAAILARDSGDTSAAYEHEMAALSVNRRSRRSQPDMRDVRILASAADAAIEDGRLKEADTLIGEAERTARAQFGDSAVYAHVLATRGRLRLHTQEFNGALDDLEYAAMTFRKGSQANMSRLPAILVHLAQVAQALGDGKKARLSIEQAYNIDLEFFGADHPETLKDLEVMNKIRLIDQITMGGKSWNR
jgi:tetratricopeptide (TPR) repeat protein